MKIENNNLANLPRNCIANENSNCIECEIEGKLICFVEKRFANIFAIGNASYRLLAITIFILSGLLIGNWWMVITYTSIVIATFLIIEPRLLCSHCPYYEKEGKFLKCWALRGMPKLWKYRPEPISNTEKYLMLLFGTFIDLFPFVGLVWSIIYFAMNFEENLVTGTLLIIISVFFLIIVGYFSKVLLGNTCKKCANFSCAMNKVPEEIVNQFLERNPKMRDSWFACGWKLK